VKSDLIGQIVAQSQDLGVGQVGLDRSDEGIALPQ
jgi:hypothetical protein